MKLYTVSDADGDWPAAERDGGLIDLAAASVAASIFDLVRVGDEALRAARSAVKSAAPRRRLEGARLDPPIRLGKVLCSGINYRGHAIENPNAKMPTEPFFFAKLPTSIVGMDAPVAHPESDVMPAIFGYTLLNDISARDVQFKDNQITLGKNFDGFAPIGPCIVTADELPRPDQVRLMTRLNGRTLQDGSTSDWLFPLPRLIGFLSHVMTLEPGDIVSTGTPAGVGIFQNPPVFMKPGDVVEIEAEGIGVLRNPIVAS